jgi:hypothetical protein
MEICIGKNEKVGALLGRLQVQLRTITIKFA